MIVSHVWRPVHISTLTGSACQHPIDYRPCGYMSCRRPRAEHERAITLRDAS